jgi:hypothetical protein
MGRHNCLSVDRGGWVGRVFLGDLVLGVGVEVCWYVVEGMATTDVGVGVYHLRRG